jgi:FemAB-related protein (PEP-CTERM system-associated)
MTDADVARWESFVENEPSATFFHRAGWRTVIERAFGHRTHFLMSESDGMVRGVLPLAEVRSALFGHSLISTPFCVYGGVASTDDAARLALVAEARSLAERLGVGHLELRNLDAPEPGMLTKDMYVTFRKTIDPDPEKNLPAIPRKQRAMIRKAIDAGLSSVVDDDPDRCYRVYSDSVRHLGTPVFGHGYFRVLKEVFGNACETLTVMRKETVVASVLSFYFRDQVLPYYGGGTREARELAGNDFMYWELMRRSCERGVRVFDYGRSKQGTGSYSFKKNWGFKPEPLHYSYRLVRANALPDVNPLNPKYRLFIETWKRLPTAVTNIIGPRIARNLG